MREDEQICCIGIVGVMVILAIFLESDLEMAIGISFLFGIVILVLFGYANSKEEAKKTANKKQQKILTNDRFRHKRWSSLDRF